ncbi:MAG: AzlD domain-containing protein [Epulopiscium sp.]|nr:AzlD domain-containing protein [Candidatus Epulonipiscium sp.]
MITIKTILAVLIMAIVTYIPRALPLTFFRKKIESPWIRSFLYYVPYAVLGAMIFPAILYSTQSTVAATLGLFIAILLAFLEKNLVVVAMGSIFVVYLCEFFLVR